MPIIIYPSFSLPPTPLSTTTPAPPQGGICLFPDATRRTLPQQPQGEILPPGKFTNPAAPNTTYGGESAAYPNSTRRLMPQQPQGEALPPGAFTTVAPVAAPQGWPTSHPDRTTRGKPVTFPESLVEPYFPVSKAGFDVIFVNRIQGKDVDSRLRRHSEVVAAILNSFLRQGIIRQVSAQEYTLDLSKIT